MRTIAYKGEGGGGGGGLILAIFVRKYNVDYPVSKLPTFRFCIVYIV